MQHGGVEPFFFGGLPPDCFFTSEGLQNFSLNTTLFVPRGHLCLLFMLALTFLPATRISTTFPMLFSPIERVGLAMSSPLEKKLSHSASVNLAVIERRG
jgi:hypothetical protein